MWSTRDRTAVSEVYLSKAAWSFSTRVWRPETGLQAASGEYLNKATWSVSTCCIGYIAI